MQAHTDSIKIVLLGALDFAKKLLERDHLFHFDAFSFVSYIDCEYLLGPVVLSFYFDLYFWWELQSILNEIDQDLFQMNLIADELRR